jgi:hypothetical protein
LPALERIFFRRAADTDRAFARALSAKLQPTPHCAVARTVHPRNFAAKMPSRASIS